METFFERSAAHSAESETRDAGDIVVMSFNIRYGSAQDGEDRWENRRGMVFDFLRAQQPDVLGLQEALRFQIDALQEEALPQYALIAVGRDDGVAAGEHCALFFRQDRFLARAHGTFWLSDTPEIPGSKTWGNTLPRICTWVRLTESASGHTFTVYNLHLDHNSQPARERSIQLLQEQIRREDAGDSAIVLGDFNAAEDNPAVLALTAEAVPVLRDTFRTRYPDAREIATFHGFEGNAVGEKIDYIFASPNWEVLDAPILRVHQNGRYLSDHFPLAARLRRTAPR